MTRSAYDRRLLGRNTMQLHQRHRWIFPVVSSARYGLSLEPSTSYTMPLPATAIAFNTMRFVSVPKGVDSRVFAPQTNGVTPGNVPLVILIGGAESQANLIAAVKLN